MAKKKGSRKGKEKVGVEEKGKNRMKKNIEIESVYTTYS